MDHDQSRTGEHGRHEGNSGKVLRCLLVERECDDVVNYPTLHDLIGDCDYTKPIPPLPDEYLTWPGKEQGKPKQPVFWIEPRAKS